MGWTEAQKEAIESRGKNLLLSAAAGSGKTSVLVERIKKLIIEEGVSLSEFLVVTFTNAAAADMREKIVKALVKALEDAPEGDSGRKSFLQEQLDILPHANISTFHAFALVVIRKYFHLIDIEPNFKICDEARQILLQADAMDRLFETLFLEKDERLLSFLDAYGTAKSYEGARSMISDLHRVLQSLPRPFEWLDEAVTFLGNEMALKKVLVSFMVEDSRKSLESSLGFFRAVYDNLADNGLTSLAEKAEGDLEQIQAALEEVLVIEATFKSRSASEYAGDIESGPAPDSEAIADSETDYDAIFSTLQAKISNIAFARFAAKNDEKETYALIKPEIDEPRTKGKTLIQNLTKRYFQRSLEASVGEILATKGQSENLAFLVREFDCLYSEGKVANGLVDFNDIEHYALEILDNPEVSEGYRKAFTYIFVDEYQDSNLLQDTLISKIKRENNLFLVGDVKQSIYKFRLAEPELFLAKYALYRDDKTPLSACIDLNTNFRCKGRIIQGINLLCGPLLPDYERGRLFKGVAYEGDLDYPVELHLACENSSEDNEDDFEDWKKTELEANLVADLIERELGRPIDFPEAPDGSGFRRVTMRDIVVLMRGTKQYAATYYEVLMNRNISVHIDDSDGYFDTIEIELFLNLLRVVDNKRQDIPLISLLHSPIFDFSMEDLGEIRSFSKWTSYFKAFEAYAGSGESLISHGSPPDATSASLQPTPDANLQLRCQKALNQIKAWKKEAITLPLPEFCWKLMEETGYYLYAGALPGGRARQGNLRALVDKALSFADTRGSSLYDFIRYIDALKKRKVPMGQVSLKGENENVVRIMTIHKSKGLEFPVVILTGLGRGFNVGRGGGALSVHKEVGLGLRLMYPEKRTYANTSLQTIINRRQLREEMDEETRVLYVALTRAKDKLILTGVVNQKEKAMQRFSSMGPGTNELSSNYLDMVAPTFLKNGREFSYDGIRNLDPQDELHTVFEPVLLYTFAEKQDLQRSKAEVDRNAQRIRKLLDAGPCENTEATVQPTEVAELKAEVNRRLSFTYIPPGGAERKSKYSVSQLSRLSLEKDKDALILNGSFEPETGISGGKISLRTPNFMTEERKDFSASERGTIFHKVMEKMDFKEGSEAFSRSQKAGEAFLGDLFRMLEDNEILTPEELAAVNREQLQRFLQSPLGRRGGKAQKVYKEQPFNLMLPDPFLIEEAEAESTNYILVQGIIDCYFEEIDETGERAFVLVDYKTGKKPDEQDSEIWKVYNKQVAIYKEALSVATGIPVKESYLYFSASGEAVLL